MVTRDNCCIGSAVRQTREPTVDTAQLDLTPNGRMEASKAEGDSGVYLSMEAI